MKLCIMISSLIMIIPNGVKVSSQNVINVHLEPRNVLVSLISPTCDQIHKSKQKGANKANDYHHQPNSFSYIRPVTDTPFPESSASGGECLCSFALWTVWRGRKLRGSIWRRREPYVGTWAHTHAHTHRHLNRRPASSIRASPCWTARCPQSSSADPLQS